MTDLATQHADRQGVALVQGAVHAAEWIFREHKEVDHGIDAHMESIVDDRVTGRLIALQIKTGSSYFEEPSEDGFVYRGKQRHLDYWLEHSLPVLLLLVDLANSNIYWVQVTESQIASTGKGWKITVPRTNLLNASALGDLGKIAMNLKISRPYSILQLDDISHAAAKRYSAHVLLNSDFPKNYVRSLASEITKQLGHGTWLRNPELEKRFEECPADVVWLFMCRTIDDSKQSNWLCRTQWISPTLDNRFQPTSITSGVTPGEIGIVWSDMRGTMERFALERELSKGDAVSAVTNMMKQVDQHIGHNLQAIESFIEAPCPDHAALPELRIQADHARDLYFRGNEIGIPPLELSDLMTAFDSVLASFDNAFMLFAENLETTESCRRAAILAAGYLRSFDQDRTQLQEEAKRRSIHF